MEQRFGDRPSAAVPGPVLAVGAGLILVLAACGSSPQPPATAATTATASVVRLLEDPHVTDARWVSSDNLRVTINRYGKPRLFLTSGFDDFNPTWTRDGTDQIIFNRYAVRGSTSNDIYLISPDGSIGDEVLVSNPANGYEWGFSGLRDGRIFVDRVSWATRPPTARSFLLTPRPGGVGVYPGRLEPRGDHGLRSEPRLRVPALERGRVADPLRLRLSSDPTTNSQFGSFENVPK